MPFEIYMSRKLYVPWWHLWSHSATVPCRLLWSCVNLSGVFKPRQCCNSSLCERWWRIAPPTPGFHELIGFQNYLLYCTYFFIPTAGRLGVVPPDLGCLPVFVLIFSLRLLRRRLCSMRQAFRTGVDTASHQDGSFSPSNLAKYSVLLPFRRSCVMYNAGCQSGGRLLLLLVVLVGAVGAAGPRVGALFRGRGV